MRRTNWSLIISIAILAVTIGVIATYAIIEENGRYWQDYATELRDEYYELADFLQFLDHLRTHHYFYDEGNDLIRGAIEGMIAQTDDPWARLMTVEEYWSFADALFGSFSGLGIRVMEVDGYTIIVETIQGSPAEIAGLQPGDAIISVGNVRYDDHEFEEFIKELPGASGTVVTLEIQRASDLFYQDLTRGNIIFEEVELDTFEREDKVIGYVSVSSFGVDTQSEFSDAITELERIGIDGLIIDMRNNPGGALLTLNTMINYLLPDNRIISTIINRDGRETVQRTRGDDSYRLDVDIVTLINGNSASASELFAAAMMESGGFEVIGTTSYGKGTAQTPMHIGDNILISTIQEGLTPTGNFIEGYGVTPTIYVEMPEFHYFSPIHLGTDDILEYDMVDARIANAQLILESLGYDVTRTDGYFDASTATAVLEFQRSSKLNETGNLNPETATALSKILFAKMQNTTYDTQLSSALDFFLGYVKQ